MKKIMPHTLKANWGSAAKRPSWNYVTSAELAKILGVHLQTINNWKLRGILPEPEINNRSLRGNKNYYKISTIRAWLENKTEDQVHTEWAAEHLGIPITAPEQIQYYSKIFKTAL